MNTTARLRASLADRVALAWAGFASRAALAADPVVTLLVDEHIRQGCEENCVQQPENVQLAAGGADEFFVVAALGTAASRPWAVPCWRRGKSEENHGNC